MLSVVLTTGFSGVLIVCAIGALGLGHEYFLLDSTERPAHYLHDTLRPGGTLGAWLGVVGTALMIGMLLYSVRKRYATVTSLGPIVGWLRFHMICGVMGPVLIVIHGGFVWPKGLVAIGFWCMLMVSASGIFGRYVYGFFPRTTAGIEMDLERAQQALADLRARLVETTKEAQGDHIGLAVAEARDLELEINNLVDLVKLNLTVRRRSRRITAHLRASDLSREACASAREELIGQLHLKQSLATWEISRRLFRYWHLFHLPLAKAMYMIILIHIFNAVFFGGVLKALQQTLH